MQVMNEKGRIKIIFEAHKYGGISLRRQKLRIHKNGAKFPVSKTYIDDGLLDPNISYTLVLIPEMKIADKTFITLIYFHRKKGPLEFYTYPENALNEKEKWKIAEVMEQASGKGFFIHQSSILSSLNYYFEITSEWARGKKEMLMISLILDKQHEREFENIFQKICGDLISKLKNKKDLFKALYFKDIYSYPEVEHSNVRKISENLCSSIKEFYKEAIISIRKK